jgi:endonuclease III
MKNATKHADAIRALFRKLSKTHDVPPRPALEVPQAVLRAVLQYDASDDIVADAEKVLHDEFIDLNELRVATELEVIDFIGAKYPRAAERATTLRSVLQSLFERENSLKLDRLRELKKPELRTSLQELPGMTPYVEAYLMQTVFATPAVPLDESAHGYLVDQACVDADAPIDDAHQFVESTFKGDDSWSFFSVLRADSRGHQRATPRPVKKEEKKKK